MLVNSVRFYERILAGIEHPDPEVQEYAVCCMSYLVCFLRLRMINLPPHVAAMLDKLPEVPHVDSRVSGL